MHLLRSAILDLFHNCVCRFSEALQIEIQVRSYAAKCETAEKLTAFKAIRGWVWDACIVSYVVNHNLLHIVNHMKSSSATCMHIHIQLRYKPATT